MPTTRAPASWKPASVGLCFFCHKPDLNVDTHNTCAWLCGCYHCLECGDELPEGGGVRVNNRTPFCAECAKEEEKGTES